MQTKTDQNAFVLHKVELFAEVETETVPVTAIIRKPFECVDGSWLCAANISGLFHRKADLESNSAETSVVAAKRFVVSELAGYLAGGGKLYTNKHKPVVDLRELFPRK